MGDQPADPPQLKLIIRSKDGKDIEIEEAAARKSIFLSEMLDNTGADQELLKEALPVDFSAETLEKVFDWCNRNKNVVGRVKDPQNPRITLTEEEEEYLRIPGQKLLQIFLCANFLHIGEMIEIISQRIANMGAGKTTEEMRKIYMLKDDLTPDQKEEIRKKHEWCEIR